MNTNYPDPGTPVHVIAQLGKFNRHEVKGVMVEHDDEKVTIRPAGAYSTVWFDTHTVSSIEPIDHADLEDGYETYRFDHPLPETIREHMVRHHGYSRDAVAGSSTDSLLDHHDTELHRDGVRLSHVHGLTARERDLVSQIRKAL